MAESRYPEMERRREMLRLIYAWTQAQPDANAPLGHNELIEELADPRAELLARLDNISEAIRTLSDEDAPPEQKKLAEKALGELKHFLRGLPPGAATELGFRALGG